MRAVRNIIVLLFACCALSGMAQRDVDFDTELSVGIKGGVSIPSVSFSPSIAQQTWVGYTTGLAVRYTEEKLFGLIAELNFTRRGWNEKFEGEPYSYRRSLDYIEIPFLAHIYFGNKTIHGFVNLGPQVGYLLSDSYQSNFDIHDLPVFADESRITEVYTMSAAHRFDYGITGGLGFELRFKRHIIVFEGRYYFGLGDLFGNHKADVFSGSSANRGFLASIAYLFRIK